MRVEEFKREWNNAEVTVTFKDGYVAEGLLKRLNPADNDDIDDHRTYILIIQANSAIEEPLDEVASIKEKE